MCAALVAIILAGLLAINGCKQSQPTGGGGTLPAAATAACKTDAQCQGGKSCIDGKCVECAPKASRVCWNNEVYWADSCGRRAEKIQACGANSTCTNGICSCIPGFVMQNGICVAIQSQTPHPPQSQPPQPPANTLPPPSLNVITGFIESWKSFEYSESLYDYISYYDSNVKYYNSGTLTSAQLTDKVNHVFTSVDYVRKYVDPDSVRIIESSDSHAVVTFNEEYEIMYEQTGESKSGTATVRLRLNRYGPNDFRIAEENSIR